MELFCHYHLDQMLCLVTGTSEQDHAFSLSPKVLSHVPKGNLTMSLETLLHVPYGTLKCPYMYFCYPLKGILHNTNEYDNGEVRLYLFTLAQM